MVDFIFPSHNGNDNLDSGVSLWNLNETNASRSGVPWHLTFTAMLSIFLLIGTGPWRAIVRVGSLRFLGYISYGLYLVRSVGFGLIAFLRTSQIIYRKAQNSRF